MLSLIFGFFLFFLSPQFTNGVTCSTSFATTTTTLTPKALKITTAILAFKSTTALFLSKQAQSFYSSPYLKIAALDSTLPCHYLPPLELRNSKQESPLPGILEIPSISSAFSLSMTTAPFLPSSTQFRLPVASGNNESGGSKTNILGSILSTPREESLFFSPTALKNITRVILSSFRSTSLLVFMPNLLPSAYCWICKLSFGPSPDLKIAALDSNLPSHPPFDLALQEPQLPSILDISNVSSAFSLSTTTSAFLHSPTLFQHTATCGNDEAGGSRTNILANAVIDVELELGVRRRGQRPMPGGGEGGGGFEGWDSGDDGDDGDGDGDGRRGNGNDDHGMTWWEILLILAVIFVIVVIVILAIYFYSPSELWGGGPFLF